MKQGTRNDFEKTTQGKYAVAPDGTLLGETNHRDPDRILRMITAALNDFEPRETKALESQNVDKDYARVLPENGRVIRVRTQILGGYEEPENRWQEIFQSAIARDNLWILEKEIRTLSQGEFPQSLSNRLARFNLIDNTRGEPPMWSESEVRALDVQWKDGLLSGNFELETEDKSRGFEGQLHGHIELKDGKLVRFDLVAKGDFWGEGRYTPGAPSGKFPIAMAFELADGSDRADRVAPQGTKGWLPNYWQLP